MKFSFKLVTALIAVILTVCCIATVFATADVSAFTDFPAGSWSDAALRSGVANGLIIGKGDGRIAPKDYITRAETATIINRAFGATVRADISQYTDVSPSKWYYAEMQKAVNMRTVEGVSATQINPEGYITREQVFTILARALVISDTDETKLMTFADGSSVSSWARGYTAALVNRGYVNGNTENRLKPRDYITREEFAQVMHNIFKQYIVGEDYKLSNATYGTTVVRTPNLTLNNLVINGDLIVADGVGRGDITLKNVRVSGRILFRGGEGKVKIEDGTTTGQFVIVHDVNGTVNFHNYRTHPLFKGIVLDTHATFLTPAGSGGGGGGSTKPDKEEYTITFNGTKYFVTEGGKIGDAKAEDGTKLSDALSDFISSQKSLGYDVAYTFNGNAIDSSADKIASESGTIEFTKTPIQYKVTYELGGDDAYFDTTPDTNITVEETLTLPTPKRDGYKFVAWYLEQEKITPVTVIPTGTTSDITVYADWKLATDPVTMYTITFNGTDYEVEEGKALATNAALKEAMDAVVPETGYTIKFKGTYIKNGSTETIDVTTDTPAVADMTITVVKTAIVYTITYNTNDGSLDGTEKTSYTVEDADYTLPTPTRYNYNFGGWYEEEDFSGTEVKVLNTSDAEDKTYYAKWTPVQEYFIMTYEGKQYPIKAGERLDSNAELMAALDAAEQKPGYLLRWKGYYVENGQEKWTGINITTKPDRDMTIKPDYTLSYYGIWLYSNGEQYQEIRYCIYDEKILPVPSDIAYFFDGWYENEQFTGNPVTKIGPGVTGSIYLYAKWTPKAKYTITYNGTDYYAYEDQKIKDAVDALGGKLSDALATYVAPDGYERDGFKVKGTNTSVDLEANAYADIEIEPNNKAIEYSIKYMYNGQEVLPEETYTAETLPYTLPAYSKTGYIFGGWYNDAACTGTVVTTIEAGTTGNKTYYAKLTEKFNPELGFSFEKDEANKTVTVYIVLSDIPNNLDDIAAISAYYTQTPKNMTLVNAEALFAAGSFAYSDGAVTWANETDSITSDELKENGGKLFKLVYSYTIPTDGDVVLSYTEDTEIASSDFKEGAGYTKTDITIPFAKSYTVTFDGKAYKVQEGEALSTNADLKAALGAVQEKDGYTLSFEGTYTVGGEEKTEAVTADTIVNTDMAIEAKYTAIKYTITYMYDGTEVLSKGEYTVEILPFTLPDYSKEGYIFEGWYDNERLTGTPVTEIAKDTIGDKTFYAKLTEEIIEPGVFTVTFYEGTNVNKGSIEVEAGSYVAQSQVDEKLGSPENYKTQKGYTNSDGVVHEIYPELWYNDGTEWKIFKPEEVKIVKDTDVYLLTRYVAAYYDTDLEFRGIKLPQKEIVIPYDSNTDLWQSAMDTLTAARDVVESTLYDVEYALDVDLFSAMLEKAAKTGIVDADGNILNPEVPVPLHKLLTEELIMKQIDNYIDTNINNEEFIAEILRNDTVVNMLLEDEGIRNKVLSDESMRNKLLTDSVIKEMISKDSVIDWIFNATDFKQKFVDSDETFDYIIGDLKQLLEVEDYHNMIIDACVDFVIDVYFEEEKDSEALVNYIDSVLDSDAFIKQIEENKELRPLFKEEIKELIAELADKPSTDPTKKEIYEEIRTNATIKQSIIDSVINNEDIMANLRGEVREDLKKTPAESKYRALVIEVIRSEFERTTSTLKAEIIESIKEDLHSPASSLRSELVKAVKDDLSYDTDGDPATVSTLKDDLVAAVKTDLGYDTDGDDTTVSSLKASVVDAVQSEFEKSQSDIRDNIIKSVKEDFASSESVLKDKIITAIKTEFQKDESEFKKTVIQAIKDDFESSESVLKDKIIIAIKGEFEKPVSEFKDTVIAAVKADFESPESVLKDKVIAAVEADFANGGSLKSEIINKVKSEVVTEGSSLRKSILTELSDPTSDVADMVKQYVRNDNDTKAKILEMAKDDTQNPAIKTAAQTWIEAHISTAKNDIRTAALSNADALKILILESGATDDEDEAVQYAEDYISESIESEIREKIDTSVNDFFNDEDSVVSVINANFNTFYAASVGTLFDDLYADSDVFDVAYESFIGADGKLEETFDKYIETDENLENAVDTFISVPGKLTEAINTYVNDSASLDRAINLYVDDEDRLAEAVDFYVNDEDRLAEAVDFYVDDTDRLAEAVDFYVNDEDRLTEAVNFYVDDEGRLTEAINFYIEDDTRLTDAIDFYIEDEGRLTSAINTYIDNASDTDIEDAINTYIENDDNLISAINKYIEDDNKLIEIFDIVKGDNANLIKAFDKYIENDANLDEAFGEFTKDDVAFDSFYEKHLGVNADDPELFNTLFEDYYHAHVHEVAKSAYDEAVLYKDYVDNPEDPDNAAKLEKRKLYELIMDYVHDYTDKLVVEYANGELEENHPELVDTIDSLMHNELPTFIREEYKKEDSEIRKLVDQLIEEEGRKLIDQYVSGAITDEKTLKFIDDTIKQNITVIVDSYVDGTLREDIKQLVDDEIESYMNKLINDYINDVGDARDTLGELVPTYAQDAVDALKDTDAFKNTISDFTSGNGVRVNEGNIMFISILSDLMGEYDYDKIMADFAPEKVAKLADKIGHDLAAKYVNTLLDTFVDGIKGAQAKLEADLDNDIEGTEYKFTTTPRVRVYIMDDFVVDMYNKAMPKAADKLNSKELIAQNPYAQKLINKNWITELLDFDITKVSEEVSGYSIKKGEYDKIDEVYGSPIMTYIDIALENTILLYDAVMWYGDNYTEASVEAKLDAVSALMGTYANKANDIIMHYIQTGELPKGYTPYEIADKILDRVLGVNDKIDDAYDKVEDKYYENEDRILELVDKIKNFYTENLDRDYTDLIDLKEISVYADGKAYPLYQIALGMYEKNNAFNIDTLATAIDESANYHNINKLESAMDKIKSKLAQFEEKNIVSEFRIFRNAYKFTLNSKEIRGRETGTHTVKLRRYFE